MLFENRRFAILFLVSISLYLTSQFFPARQLEGDSKARTIISNVQLEKTNATLLSGWRLSQLQWTQFEIGFNYFFGINPVAITGEYQALLLRVNSIGSAVFSLFLGLSAVLLPLILLLLLWKPLWAWWCTPTMVLSSLWWLSDKSLPGFYLWISSALVASILVISVLIERRYFRYFLNAFAGPKSLPFHLPVIYIALLIVVTLLGGW